jgi:MFS family permease
MKIDLVGPRRRGLALGLNEASGYVAVATAAFVTGLVAESAGLRPAPFLIGIVIAGLGVGGSVLFVRETRQHVAVEQSAASPAAWAGPAASGTWRRLAWRTTVAEPSLSAASQAGLVNNLNDALAWGLLPMVQAAAGLPIGQIALLAAIYPATWGLTQIATGALSDRIGRRRLIVAGMLTQAAAIAAIVIWTGFVPWLVAAVALGLGTAMVYPTLIAVVADIAEPRHRGAVVGIYRFWRDLGIAIGAVLIGIVANAFGASAAILVVATITAGSGLIVAIRMAETRPAG